MSPLIAPPVPSSVEVQFQPAIKYSIRLAKTPEETLVGGRDGKAKWKVAGHWIHLDIKQGAAQIDEGLEAGKDGSVYTPYTMFSEPMTSAATILWPKEKKWVIKAYDPTGRYQDAKDEFYSDCGDDPGGIPLEPYYLFIRRAGAEKQIGLGALEKAWWPNEVLVNIMVNSENRPCAFDEWTGSFLRCYDHERPFEIGNYKYFDALPDHTLVLTTDEHVYEWRKGVFTSAVHFPKGWVPIAVNQKGDVLMRFLGPHGRNEYASDDQEVYWTAALLKENRMYPIRFARPRGTEHMWWSTQQDKSALSDDGSFAFAAIGKHRSHYYRVSPVKLRR